MKLGIDCAFAGTTEDFNLAAAAGVEWVGEYFGGVGCFHVWTNADRAARRASDIKLSVPIWVPAQSFGSNPSVEASQAISSATILGYNQVIGLDVEENSGATPQWLEAFGAIIVNDGYEFVMYHGGDKSVPSSAHSWMANWTGNAPTNLSIGSAQQYRGATNAYNMSVDFDACDDTFPLEGAPKSPTVKPNPITIIPTGVKMQDICVFVTSFDKNEQVFYVDTNGALWHHYWDHEANKWSPAEGLGGGWAPDTTLKMNDETGTYQVWGTMANGHRAQVYWSGHAWVVQPL